MAHTNTEQSLGLLYHQLKRAVQVYDDTGSRYARLRARDLVAEMRGWLNDVDHLLALEAGLVERYGESEDQGEHNATIE
jgi:hypothetical protein